MTMFMDPRYKKLPFYDTTTRLKIEDNLQWLQTCLIEADKGEASSFRSSQTTQPLQALLVKKKDSNTPKEQLFSDIIKKDASVNENRSNMFREVALYKLETAAKLDSNPLDWWERQVHQYTL